MLISIDTTRHSTFIKRMLEHYPSDLSIRVRENMYINRNSRTYTEATLQEFLRWCTKKNLRNLTFFSVKYKGDEIFGFWDHPSNMWADVSTLPVIEQLAKEKIVRYHIAKQAPTLGERVMAIFKRPNQAL